MAGVSVSPVGPNYLSSRPFPTPSPFSAASTRWSSRPSVYLLSLFLRLLGFIFSFVSALALAVPSSNKDDLGFSNYPSLMYCFIVVCVAFIYSAFQLFKGVCDLTHRGILISDPVSDYTTFIFDQAVGYLLISSSSVAIPVIKELQRSTPLWKATIVATSASFGTFGVLAMCALVSGYKLCKRIIW